MQTLPTVLYGVAENGRAYLQRLPVADDEQVCLNNSAVDGWLCSQDGIIYNLTLWQWDVHIVQGMCYEICA